MGQRSRKRGRRDKPADPTCDVGERSRRETAPQQPAPARAAPRKPAVSRSEERNAAVRATLAPLAPGERPWAVRIGVVIALLVGAGNLLDVIAGARIGLGGTHAGVPGVVLFSVLMIVCAVGMWQLRYWAVLGFQAILVLVILIFTLLLIRASNLLGFVVAIVVVGGGGLLFYKLVRTLSRIQLPKYKEQ
ncbi:MAG: hypothetical protein DLM64_14140 [Solirubrobacterales bacterium]|nr:MAG: hypothetical protein DLM64_14140 [Solirubrobacterales bacterium]